MNIFNVFDRYGFVCGDSDSDCTLARKAIAELIAETKRLRNYVDVSTINNSQRTTAGWTARIEAIDTALKNIGEEN